MSETAPDQTAPRAQSIAFLENLLGHASEHVRILTQAVDRCRDCDDAEAARVLTEVKASSTVQYLLAHFMSLHLDGAGQFREY